MNFVILKCIYLMIFMQILSFCLFFLCFFNSKFLFFSKMIRFLLKTDKYEKNHYMILFILPFLVRFSLKPVIFSSGFLYNMTKTSKQSLKLIKGPKDLQSKGYSQF